MTCFFYREVDAELHFHRDSDGKVNAATLHQDGQQLKFLKKCLLLWYRYQSFANAIPQAEAASIALYWQVG